jgi:hypothetical protein
MVFNVPMNPFISTPVGRGLELIPINTMLSFYKGGCDLTAIPNLVFIAVLNFCSARNG